MKAKDVMTTRVVTVGPEETVAKIADLMVRQHISAVPVVDKTGIVGIVSEGDLIRRKEVGTERGTRSWWLYLWRDRDSLADEFAKAHGMQARDVMTTNVITVGEDTALQEVAATLERNRIKRVPVVRDGKVVGIISRANIVQALAAAKHIAMETFWDDAAIKEQIEQRLDKEPWASVGTTSVTVTDGVVDLWGIIMSDNETRATRVLIEEVAGVKEVRDHRTLRPIPANYA